MSKPATINEVAKALYEFHAKRQSGGTEIWEWDPDAEWAQHWKAMAEVAIAVIV